MSDQDLASHYTTGISTGRMVVPTDYDWGLPRLSPFDARVADGAAGRKRGRLTVIGFGVAVVGLCATLTGLLALEGFVISLLGAVLCANGAVAVPARLRAGRGMALVGLFMAVATMGLAVIAMTHLFGWPNSGVNEVTHWHNWLVNHLSWLHRWA